ncbi:hypothetical protein IAT40_005310 [Kwoniella sp. CBS 6097]
MPAKRKAKSNKVDLPNPNTSSSKPSQPSASSSSSSFDVASSSRLALAPGPSKNGITSFMNPGTDSEKHGNRKDAALAETEHHSECVICWEDLEEILSSAERKSKGGLGGGLALWVCEQSNCGALYCIGCALDLTRKDISKPLADPSRIPSCCVCTRPWDARALQEQAKAFDPSIEPLNLHLVNIPKTKVVNPTSNASRTFNPTSIRVPQPTSTARSTNSQQPRATPAWPRLGIAQSDGSERPVTKRKIDAWSGPLTRGTASMKAIPAAQSKVVTTPGSTIEKRITRSTGMRAEEPAAATATVRTVGEGSGWSVAAKGKDGVADRGRKRK